MFVKKMAHLLFTTVVMFLVIVWLFSSYGYSIKKLGGPCVLDGKHSWKVWDGYLWTDRIKTLNVS